MIHRLFPCVLVLCLGWIFLGVAQGRAASFLVHTPAPHEAGGFDCSPPNQTQIPQGECEALVALYASTNGPAWITRTGWLQTSMPCAWFGVSCEPGHVVALTLPANGLTGTLPPEVGNLSALRTLELSANDLSGKLPPSWDSLSNLIYLGLAENDLSGPIPDEWAALTTLKHLYLNHNRLAGELPSWLGTFSNLENLFLMENEFSGPIPVELGKLGALKQLQLGANQLTGEIPRTLGDMIALENIVLATNQLTGPIPDELGRLSALRKLNLGDNRLEGNLPPTFRDLDALHTLGLTDNHLSGSIPTTIIGQMEALTVAHLALNHFSGSIESLTFPSSLIWINLYGNQLEGHLGATLCGVGYRIDHNRFTSAHPCITPGWIDSQTIPPSNLTATLLTPAGVRLTWTAIPYTDDRGYYEVLGAAPGDSYTPLGRSESKSDTGWTVPGEVLPSEGSYCFIVRTFTPAHDENPNDLTSEPSQAVCVDLGEEPSPPLLALYALAFDTPAEHDLSWGYERAMQGLRAASGAGDKTVVALVDLPGNDTTFIYTFYAGQATLIRGLPDATGTLSPSLDEYDMTDGATLGGFLRWARQTYPTSGPTTFSYVGHGGPLIPATAYDTIFETSVPFTPDAASPLFPLPVRIDANPEFTDITPRRTLISVHHLSEALRIGSQEGAAPFTVVDLVKCMGGTIEELYALAPYASTLTSSPTYSFFAPEMLGASLATLDPAAPPETLATALISGYDSVIKSYDEEPPPSEHPRSLVALSSAPFPEIQETWQQVSYYLMLSLTKPSQTQMTIQRLESAYRQSAHYDTTYCDADWTLDVPDAVVDIDTFATALLSQFGPQAPVRVPLLTLQVLLSEAVLDTITHDGTPWFAEGTPRPTWNFPSTEGSGLGLYVDLIGQEAIHEGVTGRELSWQAHFYNDTPSNLNPYPYAFLQRDFLGVGWDEVVEKYWALRGETIHTAACLPDTPAPLSVGELSGISIPLPRLGTVTANAPAFPVAIFRTSALIVAPSVAFTITQGSTGQAREVFTDIVQARHWVSGTHPMPVSQPWTPILPPLVQAEPFTLTIMVDPHNRVREQNEADNVLTLSNVVAPAPTRPRPILSAHVTDHLQWVHTPTVRLNVTQHPSTTSALVHSLEVQVYQAEAGNDPATQIPVFRGSVVISRSLDLSRPVTVALPDTMQPGVTVLLVWGWSVGGVSIWHPDAVVTFNYAPPNTSIAAGESHFYLFQAAQNDQLSIHLDVADGENADLLAWDPHSFGEPNPEWGCATEPGDDTIRIDAAPFSGEYTLAVWGDSPTSTYTLSVTRNTLPDTLLSPCQNGQGTLVPRPTFIAPIPVEPAPPFSQFLPLLQR